MSALTLLQFEAAEVVSKDRGLSRRHLLLGGPLVLGLEIADLLKGVSVLTVQQEAAAGCVKKRKSHT